MDSKKASFQAMVNVFKQGSGNFWSHKQGTLKELHEVQKPKNIKFEFLT
jgi:hypothetical protein